MSKARQNYKRECSVEDCTSLVRWGVMCEKHLGRVRRHGSPDVVMRTGPKPVDPSERFWSKVDVGDCWEWTAGKTGNGYGAFYPKPHQPVAAHRWAWEHLVGPIPDGLQIDHLCRNKVCVNPDHLEPVTFVENIRRGFGDVGKHYRRTLRYGN